jgi:hypothetical protein
MCCRGCGFTPRKAAMVIEKMRFSMGAGVFFPAVFLAAILFGACGPKSSLNIQYMPVQASDELAGRTVGVDVQDLRSDKQVMSAAAKAELHNVAGKTTFQLVKKDGGQVMGKYDLPGLVKAMFEERVRAMGAVVPKVPSPDDPVLRIVIDRFKLDYLDRTWKLDIGYAGQVVEKGAVKAEEDISGSAERVKIIGSGDADHVATLLANSVVSKLDIAALFQRAGLSSPGAVSDPQVESETITD